MTLKDIDPDAIGPLMDEAEATLGRAVDKAVRSFLRKTNAKAQTQVNAGHLVLTAAGEPPDPLTLGELYGWWTLGVATDITPAVQAIIRRAYRNTRTGTLSARTAETIARYLANVTDRLVRGLTPPLPDAAFDAIRSTLTQANLEGWPHKQTAQRIAQEMGWETDGPYWRSELARIDSEIDAILDPLGPPHSAARETARLHDPTVQALRNDRNHAIRMLDNEYSYWGGRSVLITRTEQTSAWNYGAFQALADEGVEFKRWLATKDDRTRDTHLEADGQVAPIGTPFTVGGYSLMFPGDPAAPPEEICNCRCTQVSATRSEYDAYIESATTAILT